MIQRVLLVDDGEVDNFIHTKIIEQAKFAKEIVATTSAEEALAYLENHPDQLPELIFLDISMPVMNGFQFLQEYHDFPDSIKDYCQIVVLSSSLDEAEIASISSSPYVTDFLSKPLNENILAKIQLAFEQDKAA